MWTISVTWYIHMWDIRVIGSVHNKRLDKFLKEGTSWHLVKVSEYCYVLVMILSIIW
jgi:hypothetical protein